MPRSMSPTGALSDDEGMGRRNGAEPPSAERFTDRYWARSKRDENHQKGLHAPYRDQRKTAKVSTQLLTYGALADGGAGLLLHQLRQCDGYRAD